MKVSYSFCLKAVHEFDLRTSDIAALAGVSTARVSDFLNSRKVSAVIEEQITDAIVALRDIQSVVYPAKFDVSSPEKVEAARALVDLYRQKKQAEDALGSTAVTA